MTVQNLRAGAIVDRQGAPTRAFLLLFNQIVGVLNAAAVLAAAAAPQTRRVVGVGGLQTVAAELTDDVGLAFYKIMTNVASLPTAGNGAGEWAYAMDGRLPGEAGGAGTGVPCFWSPGKMAWIAVTSGAVVAA